MRPEHMKEIDEWHEHRDAQEERKIQKLRRKNLEKISSCRKRLEGMPHARFRVKKMMYLDKMEAYVKTWAWIPWSYKRMLGAWFYKEDKIAIEMYEEYLPLN